MTMMNQATKDFIREHQDEDVRKLAFLGSKYPEVDLPFALDQIRGRKIACAKLPRWTSIEGIIYPPHISMEQCSSEQTALYKAELAARLLGLSSLEEKEANLPKTSANSKICEFATKDAVVPEFAKNEATSERQQILTKTLDNVNKVECEERCEDNLEKIEFADLTGGFGVDFSYIAERLGVKAMYVERLTHLCEAAKENFERLGLNNAIVKNGDGVEVLQAFPSKVISDENAEEASSKKNETSSLKLIFIDPARRDDAGNKVVSLQDCTPDVTLLQDEMLAKADYVIIKLSPMLDWHQAVNELKHVREVHIVSTGNECKELLLVLSNKEIEGLKVYCVNDNQKFVFDEGCEVSLPYIHYVEDTAEISYLYEPNASLMKAGCFNELARQYHLLKMAKNSHLFASDEVVEGFPGRSFRIKAVSSFNKKELKRHLAGITKANIATRNFPLSVAELRKRLKLKDGGDTYVFATTLNDGSHVLLICEKL